MDQDTTLGATQVLAYDTRRSAYPGLEWLAMEKTQGKPWQHLWKGLDKP